jgi:anti-sigma factor RsiW
MKHLAEGTLKAYQDGELTETEQKQISQHLQKCRRCQELATSIQAITQENAILLSSFQPGKSQSLRSAPDAYQRFLQKVDQSNQKEKINMKKLFSRPYRPAWITLTVILIIGVAMAFAPVRTLANNFLGLFRLQQVSIVEVDPETMQLNLQNSAELEALISDKMTFEGGGDPVSVASVQEAAAQAGFAVRLPEGVSETPNLTVIPGGKANLQIDVAQVNAVLAAMDRADVQIPRELDGATVTINIPTNVTAEFGECNFDMEGTKGRNFDPDEPATLPILPCTTLVQMPSPTVSAPEGLNITQLGEVYLQILGLSKEEAQQYAQTVDWASTFVVPLPRYAATYRSIPIDGVQATLIQDSRQDGQYVLIWVKDGMLYALSGPGDQATAEGIARTLK